MKNNLKEIEILVIYSIMAGCSFGLKPNIMFNLSKEIINEKQMLVVQLFEVNFLDEIFPLPFDNSGIMILNKTFTMDGFNELIMINFKDRNWNITLETIRTLNDQCFENFLFLQEFNSDEILNYIFKCENQVTGYVSRFYGIKYEIEGLLEPTNNTSITYFKQISVFWIIAHKKLLFFGNDRNFQEFLQKCHQKSQNLFFYVITGFVFCGVVIVSVILSNIELIRKILDRHQNNPNPIIIVQPAPSND